GELAGRRRGEERIRKRRSYACPEHVGRRRNDIQRDVLEGSSRIVDAVTTTQNEFVARQRRVYKAEAGGEVGGADALHHAVADLRYASLLILLDHVAGLDEAADRGANRHSTRGEWTWLIQARIESRNAAARVVRRRVELVAQAKIQGKARTDFPVVLCKEVVVPGTQAAIADAAAEH